ncbi:hypothetical protein IWX83_003200 [Flavobacterium sp. CG_9.1]|uniref:hypothetical protein n=1 Tax=Flavobacterium sp. CG_9.1 TaxID=2787728 RepID=UPI0018CB974A|nr:hypothetical protein [Flavobacterium sp. CG_9.1]MBG6063390.1 hypothetical protein [Flavobacterium sp. CG_9.1]
MKLTTEQIEYVSNYIKSFDIKWYELQVELTDHMVNSMEEIWEKDPELTFHQVKQFAENEFGRNGFKALQEERRIILYKEFNRNQWKMMRNYLKFPKIIMSVLSVVFVYRISFYFDDVLFFNKILFGILAVFQAITVVNRLLNRKINGKRFLALETVFSVSIGAIYFTYWGIFLAKSYIENLRENHLLFLPFYCLWVFLVVLNITAIHLQKTTILKVKKQYQLL